MIASFGGEANSRSAVVTASHRPALARSRAVMADAHLKPRPHHPRRIRERKLSGVVQPEEKVAGERRQ